MMKKNIKYEKMIFDSYENNEWESVYNVAEQKMKYAKYAQNTFLRRKK